MQGLNLANTLASSSEENEMCWDGSEYYDE